MIIVIAALFGLIFGSFVNAFVWRLHEQEVLLEKKRKPSKKKLAELSILKGRSMCTHCHHELAPKDLVPLFSWLYLRGKCRYCQKPIGWQYPLVEALTAVFFAFSYAFWPLSFSGNHRASVVAFGFWVVFMTAFMALAVYDLRWMVLPNRVVFPLIGIALAQVIIVAVLKRDIWELVDALIGGVVISGLFYALFQLSAGTWIGGGDVKLAVVLGLLAGTPLKALLVLFFASVIGTIISLPLAVQAKKGLKLQIPFGPFLLAGTVIVVLFGSSIINWYSTKFLNLFY